MRSWFTRRCPGELLATAGACQQDAPEPGGKTPSSGNISPTASLTNIVPAGKGDIYKVSTKGQRGARRQ